MSKKICGVYFLFNREEVVYIGRSTDISRRIREHIREGSKVFDSYDLYPTGDYVGLEAKLISVFTPKYNKINGQSAKLVSVRGILENFGIKSKDISGFLEFLNLENFTVVLRKNDPCLYQSEYDKYEHLLRCMCRNYFNV